MAYSTQIDKTEFSLRELQAAYAQPKYDRFIAGLENGSIRTEEDVIGFTNYVKESHGILKLEFARLKKHAKTFNKEYATNYNKYFCTAQQLMMKMRSGISRGIRIVVSFCPKTRKKLKQKTVKRSAVKNSKFTTAPYSKDLFSEEYSQAVKELYNELELYINDLHDCIQLCIQVIEEEERIKQDPDRVHQIRTDCYNKTLGNNQIIVRRLKDSNASTENDVLKLKEKAEREHRALLKLEVKLFHTLDMAQWTDFVVCDAVNEARKQGISTEELSLWGDNPEQVMRVRAAIEHFDELLPEGQKEKIDGYILMRFHIWCATLPGRSLERWHIYFTTSYKGSLTPTGISAIKMQKSKAAKLEKNIDDEQQEEFNKKVEKVIKKYVLVATEQANQPKKAVNF